MARIPEEEIEKLKREVDIAAVIRARGIELKPSTRGSLVGHCPFHDDAHPSMSVTPGKGLFRCMSTECGKTGNVIMFVQWFDGISWRHAFELLKNGAAFTGTPTCAPVKKSTVPKLENPLAPDADDQAALRQVLDYYHARLKENPDALGYLQKRGISAEAIATFRVGFVDRTLGLRVPQKNRAEGATLRSRLARLGIMRDTGHEHFRGRVVFPVIAENGEIGTIYGRAIGKVEKNERHLFLPGPQRGVWNPAALRSAEVIVTEGIIDALAFWGAGFRHVTTSYSAKALPDELLDALVAARVKRVLLAFDRDASGDTGTATAAAQLAPHGIECLRVMFPPGHDASSYALAVTPPEKSLGVLLRSAVLLDAEGKVTAHVAARAVTPLPAVSSSDVSARAPSSLAAEAAKAAPQPDAPEKKPEPVPPTVAPEMAAKEKTPEVATVPAAPTVIVVPAANASHDNAPPVAAEPSSTSPVSVVKNDSDEIVLSLGDREWRVRGLQKNTGFESLKVTLRVTCAERWHLDQLDLCVARQREHFIAQAAAETLLKPELVKRDLGHVLQKLEELQEARLKADAEPKKTEPTMTAEERAAALALLRDPKLLDRLLADFALCGLVGEQTNKLVGYLAAVSRLLDRPLAVIVRATTAAGKSSLMDAILAMMPTESRVKYSALTGQALYYLGGGTDLKHKILAIVEEEGAEKASYALKLLQSEGELSIASTGKDPQTGRMVTQEYRVEGPVMIFLTTTAVDLDEELLNRCLVLTVDESREQTAAIHAAQRRAETLAGLVEDEARGAVLTLHRNAQRLLRPLKVVNPYGEKLTFLDDRTRTRRDHKKYLTLIRTIALLHQHQRPVKTRMERGRAVEYIEVTLGDIAAANRLAHDVLGRCLDDMPPQTRRLLALIQAMQRQGCAPAPADAAASGRAASLPPRPWRRRELRAFCGWSDTALKVHLSRLVELEYVAAQRDPDHLQGLLYELMFDGDVTAERPHLSGLLDVEKLRAVHDYDANRSSQAEQAGEDQMPTQVGRVTENRSGENGDRSGSGQPPVSPWSGGGQGAKNGDSSSENAVPASSDDKNARPGSGATDAAA